MDCTVKFLLSTTTDSTLPPNTIPIVKGCGGAYSLFVPNSKCLLWPYISSLISTINELPRSLQKRRNLLGRV